MPQQRYYLAIDIGASSGRHVLGSVNGNGVIELEEVHRFDNVQVRRRGHDCWHFHGSCAAHCAQWTKCRAGPHRFQWAGPS